MLPALLLAAAGGVVSPLHATGLRPANGPDPVQEGRTSRPDQVLARTRRSTGVTPVSGVVTENSLEKVVVETDTGTRNFDSGSVRKIVFGNVPPPYREASTYFDRGDFENAAAMYRLAAGDASARDVVKASARLLAAETMMRQGARDASAFAEAASEAELFLGDYPTNREVPRARVVQARAVHLTGNPAKAAELYRTLYREAEGEEPTTGYDFPTCLLAGLRSAEAYVEAGDTLRAKEIFASLATTSLRVLGGMEDGDPDRQRILAVQAEARLGEGWSLLASGNANQAKTFFRGQLSSADDAHPALRFGARLGLAEAHLAAGSYREAQLEFAYVSAIDHTSHDRVARALVGLASCSLKLADPDARIDARRYLQTVNEYFGDTPAILVAQEMLRSLN